MQRAAPAGSGFAEIESENQIDESRSQEIDVAGNVHHANFRGKKQHLRIVMLHDLAGEQEGDDAEQSNDEMNAAQVDGADPRLRILTNAGREEEETRMQRGAAIACNLYLDVPLIPQIDRIHASNCGS